MPTRWRSGTSGARRASRSLGRWTPSASRRRLPTPVGKARRRSGRPAAPASGPRRGRRGGGALGNVVDSLDARDPSGRGRPVGRPYGQARRLSPRFSASRRGSAAALERRSCLCTSPGQGRSRRGAGPWGATNGSAGGVGILAIPTPPAPRSRPLHHALTLHCVAQPRRIAGRTRYAAWNVVIRRLFDASCSACAPRSHRERRPAEPRVGPTGDGACPMM